MSLYTTPLQFGYFMALLFAVLFWVRGQREERLTDTLMGFIMFLLSQGLQDYTFGFSGINVLWDELNGFPRGVAMLFPPTVYLYLRAQTSRQFQLRRKYLLHYVPWAVFFLWQLQFFIRGPYAVQAYQESTLWKVVGWIDTVVLWAMWVWYFRLCFKLYRHYRSWIANEFSDLESVNLAWFRNFIFVFVAGFVFQQVMMLIDAFADLDFYQDWWWNLGIVAIVVYVSIQGYTQPHMVPVAFDDGGNDPEPEPAPEPPAPTEPQHTAPAPAESEPVDEQLRAKILASMEETQLYLQPELTLSTLSKRIKAPPASVSATINSAFNRNFNEFVNGYRIEHFKREVARPQNSHLTLLSIALDSGFNSKATFNRVFKKSEGISPRQFMDAELGAG